MDIVYIYKRTTDHGQELKHSMRSIKNVTNWSGEVFVCGETEKWFSDKVHIIRADKSNTKWIDQEYKLRAICNDTRVSDDFIYFNDDFYIMEPTKITPLYDGELELYDRPSNWLKAKTDTRKLLEEMGKPYLNYDIHVPIVFNKAKLLDILDRLEERRETRLQPRSLYGNIYEIGGQQYKDRKARTSRLLDGHLLSTKRYTPELEWTFTDKSEFEK